jgi:hypothetical protein
VLLAGLDADGGGRGRRCQRALRPHTARDLGAAAAVAFTWPDEHSYGSINAKEFVIEPNVDVTRSNQEAKAGRQGQVWDDLRQTISQMRDVKRLKEVGVIRKILTSPEVPTARIGCRTVT